MKHLILILALLMVWDVSFAGTPIKNPVASFLSTYDMTDVKKVYELEGDINHDGKHEIIMAPAEPDMENYPPCYIYIPQGDGTYIVAGQKTERGGEPSSIPSINLKAYKIGWIKEINRYGLLTLVCGNGGQALCQLEAIVLENNAWKQIDIGDPVNAEMHYDELMKRFPKPLSPPLKVITP